MQDASELCERLDAALPFAPGQHAVLIRSSSAWISSTSGADRVDRSSAADEHWRGRKQSTSTASTCRTFLRRALDSLERSEDNCQPQTRLRYHGRRRPLIHGLGNCVSQNCPFRQPRRTRYTRVTHCEICERPRTTGTLAARKACQRASSTAQEAGAASGSAWGPPCETAQYLRSTPECDTE